MENEKAGALHPLGKRARSWVGRCYRASYCYSTLRRGRRGRAARAVKIIGDVQAQCAVGDLCAHVFRLRVERAAGGLHGHDEYERLPAHDRDRLAARVERAVYEE